MKKFLFFITLIFGLQSFAQTIEITPIYGYTFSGESNYYYNVSLDIEDDDSWGGILSFEVAPQSYLEFSYQTTDARMNIDVIGEPRQFYTVRYEHLQLGTLREFSTGDFRPFLKASLGTTHYKARNTVNYNDPDSWEFSGSIGGGFKKFFNERFGFRFQTNLILPMRWSGGGVYCGPYGCSGGTSFNVPLVHWEVSGGIIVKMDK